MIIVLDPAITPDRRAAIAAFLGDRGVTVRESRAPRGDLVVVTSNPVGLTVEEIQSQAGVLRAVLAGEEFVHAAREFHPTDSVIRVGGVDIGGPSLLLAAEYILCEGNGQVILCERGIRSFDPSLRNSLDLASVVLLKEMTHLPVLVDPSHATGRHELVLPMARAAAVCGADGLLLEVHPEPAKALSDGPQAILPEDLARLSADLRALAAVVGRTFGAGG